MSSFRSFSLGTVIGITLILFIFIVFGHLINSIAFKGKFDIHRTPAIDIMIILIGALQFVNGLLHWFVLGLGTKKDIIDYLKVIIGVLSLYFVLMIGVSNWNVKEFTVVIPIVLLAWICKVLVTIIFIRKNKIIKSYLR